MATLTQSDDTGTLDLEDVQAAASAPVDPDVLDRRAAELLAWLEANTSDDAASASDAIRLDEAAYTASAPDGPGRPAILVHQHVWQPWPPRHEPSAQTALGVLVDRAFSPVRPRSRRVLASFTARFSPDHDARNRLLGWGLALGVWAVAAALLVPLLIGSVIGAVDLTVDLGGDTQPPSAEQPAPDDAGADLPDA